MVFIVPAYKIIFQIGPELRLNKDYEFDDN